FGRGKDNEDEQKDDDDTQPKDKDEVKEVVFVEDAGVAKMKEVKTGISDYENIEITEGLTQDEKVISGPFLVVSKRLEDGDLVDDEEKDNKKDREEQEEETGE
ncbi:MAG: efflux transporter periplasmic adaptor subunit, partial [Chloroflexota bacterium]